MLEKTLIKNNIVYKMQRKNVSTAAERTYEMTQYNNDVLFQGETKFDKGLVSYVCTGLISRLFIELLEYCIIFFNPAGVIK